MSELDEVVPVTGFTIITGLSGAGRSEAAHCLEDLGYFVVDNLPPALLPKMAELTTRPGGPARVAIVVDARSMALEIAVFAVIGTNFFSRAVQRRSSTRLISAQLGKETLAPAAREWNIFVKAFTGTHIR